MADDSIEYFRFTDDGAGRRLELASVPKVRAGQELDARQSLCDWRASLLTDRRGAGAVDGRQVQTLGPTDKCRGRCPTTEMGPGRLAAFPPRRAFVYVCSARNIVYFADT